MNTVRTKNNLAMALSFLIGVGVAPQVFSQGGESARVLEEVVVTARKREESLYDVPVSISAYTEGGLEDAGIDNVDELLAVTPGTAYNDTNNNRATAQINIRGLSGDGIVSTFVDGMPQIGSQAANNYVDVEAVEIYRGPQSAVFGRAVYAGAINYITRNPSTTEMEGNVSAQFGQDGRSALSGWVSVPLIEDMLAVSLSAHTDSYDGPGEIKSTDGYDMGTRDTDHFRVALAFEPTDNLSMTLKFEDTSLDDGPAVDYNLDPAVYPELFQDPLGVGLAPLVVGEVPIVDDPVLRRNFCLTFEDPDENAANQNCILDPGWELERERLSFSASYDFDNGHALVFKAFDSEVSTFDHDDQDNTDFFNAMAMGFGLVNMGVETENEEDYVEVLWTSPDENRLRYSLGYSQYESVSSTARYFIHPSATFNGSESPNASVASPQPTSVENTGVFGSIFYDVTDQLTASFEARSQEESIFTGDKSDNIKVTSDGFLPRVSLNYAINEDVNAYIQYSQGAKPATVNAEAFDPTIRAAAAALEGLVVDGQTFSSAIPFVDSISGIDEEELKNYEIGIKGRFLDNQLSIEAAIFRLETDGFAQIGNLFFNPDGVAVDDVIAAIQVANPDNPLLQTNLGDTSFRVRGSLNTGNVKTDGLEIATNYLINDNWSLSGQLTYLDSFFEEACDFGGSTYGIATDFLQPPGTGDPIACTDVSGNSRAFVPEIQAFAAVTYDGELANGLGWFTRFDGRYEDEQFINNFNSAWMPSSTKFNLRAGLTSDNYRIEAYVENLFDDNTPAGVQIEPDRKEVAAAFPATSIGGPNPSTGPNVAIAKPREVGLRVSYDF